MNSKEEIILLTEFFGWQSYILALHQISSFIVKGHAVYVEIEQDERNNTKQDENNAKEWHNVVI